MPKAKMPNDLVDPVVAQCGGDLWGECLQFPKADWKYEVENDDTILGYWEWAVHQAESDGVPVESLRGVGSPEMSS